MNLGDRDDRAVSTVLGYALSLGITALLVSGLLISMSGLVENQRERTVRNELEVIGQKLAADVTAADRLVVAGTTGGATLQGANITHDLPETVAGSTYTVMLQPGGSDRELVLETRKPDITVTVTMATKTPVSSSTVYGDKVGPSSVDGGTVRITYDIGATTRSLELRDG